MGVSVAVIHPSISAELERGEKLIWSGQPRQGMYFTAQDFYLVPFSLLWGGFAIFWEVLVLMSNAPIVFPLFGSVFVLVGIYFIFGRFVHGSWRRKRIQYALTDKRIIIAVSSGVESIRLHDALNLKAKRHMNGRMTILFGPAPSLFSIDIARQFNAMAGAPSRAAFEQIEDGERVYSELKRLTGLARS